MESVVEAIEAPAGVEDVSMCKVEGELMKERYDCEHGEDALGGGDGVGMDDVGKMEAVAEEHSRQEDADLIEEDAGEHLGVGGGVGSWAVDLVAVEEGLDVEKVEEEGHGMEDGHEDEPADKSRVGMGDVNGTKQDMGKRGRHDEKKGEGRMGQ